MEEVILKILQAYLQTNEDYLEPHEAEKVRLAIAFQSQRVATN